MAFARKASVFLSLTSLSSATEPSDFDEFVHLHGRSYDDEEYERRRDLFAISLAEVRFLNARPTRSWTAGITSMADRSAGEIKAMMGWKRSARPSDHRGGRPSSLEFLGERAVLSEPPTDFNWTQLHAVQNTLDQSQCGSCWAVAAAVVLRAHSEIAGDARLFSPQQLVSCVPNPNHCGGTGGCDGATVELAMDYTMKSGLVTEAELPYASLAVLTKNGAAPDGLAPDCPAHLRPGVSKSHGQDIGMIGWERLPENQLQPVMHALVQLGPVSVSVAAHPEKWTYYKGGIYDECAAQNWIVNHAVVLVGYGEEAGRAYWTIQNSWGPGWGEHGLMRFTRNNGPEGSEDTLCGWDEDPSQGDGCDGGPQRVHVCGSCAILSNAVVPHFQKKASFFQRTVRSHLR